jgi:hypothetical protein
MKYLVYYALAALGLLFLFRRLTGRWARAAAQLLAFVLLGGVIGLLIPALKNPLGMHPSPMCSLTKLPGFVMQEGFWPPPLVAMLVLILILSLVGKKLFCGWGCPLGALQELCYLIPGLKKVATAVPFPTQYGRAYSGYVLGSTNRRQRHQRLRDDTQVRFQRRSACLGLLCCSARSTTAPTATGLPDRVGGRWAFALTVRVNGFFSFWDCVGIACPAIEPLISGLKGWLPDCLLRPLPQDLREFSPSVSETSNINYIRMNTNGN